MGVKLFIFGITAILSGFGSMGAEGILSFKSGTKENLIFDSVFYIAYLYVIS